jgi:hypothetical protein
MERVLLVDVRLIRDGEGKVSPNSYASEDEMASNHANRDRSTCQFCEQTFQVASTGSVDVFLELIAAIWLGEIELQLQPPGNFSPSSESEEAHDELAD